MNSTKNERGRTLHVGLIVLVVIVALGGLAYYCLRPEVVLRSGSLPADFPAQGFSHETFEDLLGRFARSDGRMDYDAWNDDAAARVQLESYLAAVAAYSPENAPERFPSKADSLAYWMYAYNALVIQAILERWPLESVMDVTAVIEVKQGYGFFYKLEYICGGKPYSLYAIEHEKVIGQSRDPRVHFVLNCGSESCPAMQPYLPSGHDLEPFLVQAARDFVADPRNVRIDHEARTMTLSQIFEWYEEDFLTELRRRGQPEERGLLGYLQLVAEEDLRLELSRAQNYELIFRPYDWSVNDAQPGAGGFR